MSADHLEARLKQGAACLARCWQVTRKDGVTLGFTDHDLDLEFDGIRFEARSGMDANAVERSTGLSVDNSQAAGALTSGAIGEADILAGRFDGAEVRQWLVDWSEPDARALMFVGSLGEIRQGGGAFQAELRGLAEVLNRPVGRAFLRSCDRELGDGKCGVDLNDAAFRAEGVVETVKDGAVIWTPERSFDKGWFTHGVLRWTGGKNSGLETRVKDDLARGQRRHLVFWSEPAFAVSPGDTFEILAGCDKSFGSCRRKFGNSMNFRGFPHMPGDDWVTAYPRPGGRNDGAAVFWGDDAGR